MRIYLILIFTLFQLSGFTQVDLGYQVPDKAILDLVDAPLPPIVRVNSAGTKALLLYRRSFKTIQELSEEELRLAGLRINPKTNIGSRTRSYYDMKILDIKTGDEKSISGMPANCLLYTSPSPRDATLSRMPSSA